MISKIDPLLARVLDALGVTSLNEVQKLAANHGLFEGKKDYALLSQSRTGKSFTGCLFVANEIFKHIKTRRESGAIEEGKELAIIVAPFHASARETSSTISQYFGWFLRPLLAIGEIRTTEILLKASKGMSPNVLIATPEALQDFLRIETTREWMKGRDTLAVVFDDVHSIMHDPGRGLCLMEIDSYLRAQLEPPPKRLVLSAHFDEPDRLGQVFKVPLIQDKKDYEPPEISLVTYKKTSEKNDLLRDKLLELADSGTRTLVYMKAIDSIGSFIESEGREIASSVAYDLDTLVRTRLQHIASILDEIGYDNSRLVTSGVGLYHGQMNEMQRWFIEWAFRRRYLRFLFGTEALAYGVNTPVSHVVMGDPGIDEIFRQSMMARAIRLRRGRIQAGECTVFSKSIADIESLSRVYKSPKMPVRFLTNNQISNALLGLIGLGLLRSDNERREFSDLLSLFFKKGSTQTVLKELAKGVRPLVSMEQGKGLGLTPLGNIAFRSNISGYEAARIVEGICLLENSNQIPTEFDLLLIMAYAMSLSEERSKPTEEMDASLQEFYKKKVKSVLKDQLIDTKLEPQWKRAIEYASILHATMDERTEFEFKTKKRAKRLLTNVTFFLPNFSSFLADLEDLTICKGASLNHNVIGDLAKLLDTDLPARIYGDDPTGSSTGLKWRDLSFVDFGEVEHSIGEALKSDLPAVQKIRLIELLDAVESTTSSFIDLIMRSKDEAEAKETLEVVCTYAEEGLVGSNLVKALEEEGLVERGTVDHLWHSFSGRVEKLKKRTDVPAKAVNVLVSLFTGDLVGAATGGASVLRKLAGRKKVDVSGLA
ncbi:MAG: DEAD/DEAH box helicase [Candidatus Thorarchaeota archaeon]|nr:DEAD/DEAH box helicase [Candidatus Thorarchaeota archaeon]